MIANLNEVASFSAFCDAIQTNIYKQQTTNACKIINNIISISHHRIRMFHGTVISKENVTMASSCYKAVRANEAIGYPVHVTLNI